MMYFPKARIWPGYVIDPDELVEEFETVLRVAQRTTQYQWINEAFTDPEDIGLGEHCLYHIKNVAVTFGMTSPGAGPTLSQGWDIPYNTTPQDVGDGDVAIEWVSTYPELIWYAFNFQYARADHGTTLSDFFIRSRVQIELDSVRVPGAGVYAIPIDPTPRGLGLSQRTGRFCPILVQIVPPGAHRITPVASQYSGVEVGSEGDPYRNKDEGIVEDPPDNNVVVIGNRTALLIRCQQGGWVGS